MKFFISTLVAFLFFVLCTRGPLADESVIQYAPADTATVSKALFRIGMLRTDDPAAIEEYIRIHECGLYEQYLNDEIAWTRVREAFGRELMLSLPKLSAGLEFASALQMDVYDAATSEFMIDAKAQFNNMGIVNVLDIHNGSYFTCATDAGLAFVPRMHPLKLSVKIDTPINLQSIPMSQDAADKLIALMNNRTTNDPDVKRQLTIVLKVRLTNADPLASVNDPMHRTVLGLIDDLSVYEGPERKQLLFRIDYQTPREKLQKK